MSKPANPALQTSNSLSSGLLRCLAFTEGSGSNFTDYSTNASSLTSRTNFATAPATWGTDPTQGGFVTFDGSTQDATGPDTNLPTGSNARTFAFLIRTTMTGGNPKFFGGYGTNGDSLFGFGLVPTSSSNAAHGFTATTFTHNAVAQSDEADGNWHLVHAVLDGSANLTFFVDGQPFSSTTDGNNSASSRVFTPISTTLSGKFYLGQIGGTGGNNPDGSNGTPANHLIYSGDMAGVWVWNRALAVQDISNHYSDPWQMVRPAAAQPSPMQIALSGPSSGVAGQASGTITATLNQPAGSSGIVASLASSGSGDTFSPSSLTFPSGSTTATFTANPGSTGQRTFTAASSGLTSGTLTYTATAPVATVTTVTVSPATATITGGQTQQFTATVTGTNNPSQPVTWNLNPNVGTITTGGLLTTPVATSSVQTITVTATSTADPNKSGIATVTVPASQVTTQTPTPAQSSLSAAPTPVIPYPIVEEGFAAVSYTIYDAHRNVLGGPYALPTATGSYYGLPVYSFAIDLTGNPFWVDFLDQAGNTDSHPITVVALANATVAAQLAADNTNSSIPTAFTQAIAAATVAAQATADSNSSIPTTFVNAVATATASQIGTVGGSIDANAFVTTLLNKVGALEPGKTLAESLRKPVAQAGGKYDQSTVVGQTIWRMEDGTEAYRYPSEGKESVDSTQAPPYLVQ